ncbi:hypothetical protein OBBRIDRAFT_480281 [Obba rivulosa]|uniref:Uncharacterized protein n=1 Tax=Obba rivulosa TaxID=1052685 RepID=A0A8E2B161_9APHY|nr:hypothetical protein OBBRIDRAFT_480281 [Obba rivulosa]
MRELWEHLKIIPKSFVVSAWAIQRIRDYPVAFVRLTDIWMGRFRDQVVALKVPRGYRTETEGVLEGEMKKFCRTCGDIFDTQTSLRFTESMTYPSHPSWLWFATEYLISNPAANRLKLAVDMAKGLEYLLSMKILRGNMKSVGVAPTK